MPDGESTVEVGQPSAGGTIICAATSAVVDECSMAVSGVVVGPESSASAQKTEKDPRKIARKYQLELCKKAMEENIIVYLGTGCGKTHIAVLLIYELAHLIRNPQKNICIFLAPTVALVQQQAKVIEESIGFKVGTFCGGSKRLKSHREWEKEIDQYEVLVMIPQILLHSLYHRFIKMELIALLIFDECHHAQIQSNHPYAKIMKDFYKPDDIKVPRIFGMTASPIVGKGASTQGNLPKSINSLEKLLDAKVYSVEDEEDLESFVSSPVVRVYYYGPVINDTSISYMTYSKKLAEIKRECVSALNREMHDHQSLRNTKKQLNRLHDSMIFCLENLGVCGALHASHILLSGDESVRNELIEADGNTIDDSLCRFTSQASEVFAADCRRDGIASDLSCIEVLKEPFFSKKFLRLIGILSTFRLQPNMKCIVFVNRIVTARALSYILQNLKFLASWKCHFLVGVNAGLKSMSRNTMKNILEKFRSGELNLLVATKVGEEGLDIQTCCLVIRFDLPETVASFIQSRGRARMPQSEYAFLVDSGNQRELSMIKSFSKDEDRMNMEIMVRTSSETFTCSEERIYKVDSSSACISAGYGISLLHRYCSKLPHDECKHYRRRCMIRAPCCNEIFDCRHCHNEAASMLRNPYDRHEIVRQDVKQVICSVCDTEQPVAQVCTNCGVNMGEYFCDICKFYDDDIEKGQFHCDDCGICRIGGRQNYFHCKRCGSCYSISLQGNHLCVENSMRHHCPICYEYLFDSLKDTTVMKCGHTMHCECYHEMIKHDKYCCPICSKSVIDMSRTWKRIDEEIEATLMPENYQHKKVWILCNDCNDTTEVYFHIIGQKCSHCKSYNTRTIAPPVLPQ